MAELWLIRHGETAGNQEGRFQGSMDIELNENGRQQAARLAEQLKNIPFRAIFSSPMKRALETAEMISAACHVPVQIEPRLAEISMGAWADMSFEETRLKYPGQLEAWRADPVDFRPPGGESTRDISIRVREAARDITRMYPEGKVLLVSHGLTLAALICMARNIPLSEVFDHVPGNAELVVIEWQNQDEI